MSDMGEQAQAFEAWFDQFKTRMWSKITAKQMLLEAWEAATLAEREACAQVAENGRFLHDDAPDARFGKAVAAAIRRRGGA